MPAWARQRYHQRCVPFELIGFSGNRHSCTWRWPCPSGFPSTKRPSTVSESPSVSAIARTLDGLGAAVGRRPRIACAIHAAARRDRASNASELARISAALVYQRAGAPASGVRHGCEWENYGGPAATDTTVAVSGRATRISITRSAFLSRGHKGRRPKGHDGSCPGSSRAEGFHEPFALLLSRCSSARSHVHG